MFTSNNYFLATVPIPTYFPEMYLLKDVLYLYMTEDATATCLIEIWIEIDTKKE